ncbi:SRPBCC domain-containing protein [Asticcacaulis sp. EMRT-3]|uniref:SRPBCC family protein n=1 Tax=Asticcacaulis sp. EMRT-3 TaxID=3040349 RepID=UPI0024AEF6D8|nr:SRPBCC domain-containing protein [Asticcacaulis sp. EMRT-3]MDI7776372.1 SRPBCC domain-containing protein [Asticcacaulis sp. EMRT-3]
MPDTNTDTGTLTLERDLPHPPQKVWRALTESHLIAEWLLPNDFKAEPGHAFTLRAPPMPQWDGVVDGHVVEVTPYDRLSYRWELPGGGLHTLVTLTLTPTPQGTRLHVTQSGFTAEQGHNLRGANYGWQNFLKQLEEVVARSDV